jgi:uroporphyrinogen-III synthase
VTGGWILATRPDEELAPLRSALAAKGFRVVGYPVLREEPPCAPAGDIESVVAQSAFVAFTSRRAPAALRRVTAALWPALLRLPAATVGAATAAAARREGFRVEIVGDSGGGALAVMLAARLAPGSTVLHPCGRDHREELSLALARSGIRVHTIVVYAMDEAGTENLPALPEEPPRAVLLTSPRAARAYLRASGGRFAAVPHLALGATTAAAAVESGVAARSLPRRTSEAILEELCRICS